MGVANAGRGGEIPTYSKFLSGKKCVIVSVNVLD